MLAKSVLTNSFGTFRTEALGRSLSGGVRCHSEPNKWKMAGRFPKSLPLDKNGENKESIIPYYLNIIRCKVDMLV